MAAFFSHPIPAAVVLLGLLVFFHELGHYLAGVWCGIAVETFSIGFGPRLLGFTRGRTDYRLSAVPLGGYVKFFGSAPQEEVPIDLRGKEFLAAPVWKRSLVAVAGPIANFILAFVVYSVLGHAGMQISSATVGDVIPGTAAERAGILPNDEILRMGGRSIRTWSDMENLILESPDRPINVHVKRAGREIDLTLTPAAVQIKDMSGKPATRGRAGVSRGSVPAIVSVTSRDSLAFKLGIKDGEKVLTALSVPNTKSDVIINSYFELAQEARRCFEAHCTSWELKVAAPEQINLDDKGSAHNTPQLSAAPATRLVTVDTSVWKSADPNSSGYDLLTRLGIHHAQLTIGAVSHELSTLLMPGDTLVSWDGKPVENVYQLSELMGDNTKGTVHLAIRRDMVVRDVAVPLEPHDVQGPTGRVTIHSLNTGFYGQPIEPPQRLEKYDNWSDAFAFGFGETGRQTATLVGTLWRLITGDVPLKALGGPMLIAKVAGDAAKHGIDAFLGMMALISINLGVINLFPIPVLDGGQLVMFGFEALRRRPLSEVAIENFQKIGFVLVMSLVVLATYNDISRFWKSMISAITGHSAP